MVEGGGMTDLSHCDLCKMNFHIGPPGVPEKRVERQKCPTCDEPFWSYNTYSPDRTVVGKE